MHNQRYYFNEQMSGLMRFQSSSLPLAIGNQLQNCHPNSCYVEEEKEEEEDLGIEEEDCNIKEDDEYIDRVCAMDWDSPSIYDDYPDENKIIYIRGEPITHIVDK